MDDQTPENRMPAPGALSVVHNFVNCGHLADHDGMSQEVADAIRLRHEAGETQASLASEYGTNQKFVAAVARGARLLDDLATPESARAWLVARGLIAEKTGVSEEDRQQLVSLRESLRAMAAANNGLKLEAAAVASLNEVAATIPLVLRFGEDGRVALEPAREGIDGAVGKLLTVVFDGIREGTFSRLKRCPGEGCPHIFYDASRNRTGTWCAMSVCGNRTKVRSYQRRRREGTRRASNVSS